MAVKNKQNQREGWEERDKVKMNQSEYIWSLIP